MVKNYSLSGSDKRAVNKMIDKVDKHLDSLRGKEISSIKRYDKLKSLMGSLRSIAQRENLPELVVRFDKEIEDLQQMEKIKFSVAKHDNVLSNLNEHLRIK
jgi:hypothetical protein